MKNTLFFKYGIDLFSANEIEYGGYRHWIAKIFRWRLAYLHIYLKSKFKFEINHEDGLHYYDGHHNHIWIGFILISYGT